MDRNYKIVGINLPIMICEYQKDGYTKNIKEIFKANPKGYYKYFKEILQMPMRNVLFKKRIYAVKHYLLFCYILNKKPEIKNLLVFALYWPGKIKYYFFKK